MWDAIEQNKRRSWILISVLGVLLVGLGAAIGLAFDPQMGGPLGAAAALGVWLILWIVAVAGGDSVVLLSAGAKEIQKEDAPQLWNIVEEMTIASGLGKMPRVYIIDNESPNAFATGRTPKKAAVAVTSGLLKRLNRDELQGVIAHEIAHVRNLDVRFMTYAAVMIGSIVLIAEVFLRSLWYGAGRRRSSSSGSNKAQLIMILIAIAAAILAPIFAQMLYFACSRRREYLADACAARFTRYPEGLASALEKISRHAGAKKEISRTLAPMYIINPLQARGAFSLFSTHPPMDKRVAILRAMSGGAGYAAYEAAYRKVLEDDGHCIGKRALREDTSVKIRPPTPEPKQAAIDRAREALDMVDRLAQFLIIPCVCGPRPQPRRRAFR